MDGDYDIDKEKARENTLWLFHVLRRFKARA
jgi:hypothetical protein